MKHYFYQALEENPIIAAIKNMDDLELCCSLEEIRVVFVLFGDIWYDPDDRKTFKGRREDRDRACRPDRGFKQQGDRGGLH